MRILYLHQYFVTREGPTGTRSYEFASRLVQRGHTVTMLTSGRNAAKILAVPEGRTHTEVDVDGIQVVSMAAGYNNSISGTHLSGLQRMMGFFEYNRMAVRLGRQLPRPDVVYATSTPLTIGHAGLKLARHFGVPFVFEVRDLWPQALINCGALKNPAVIWWFRSMERKFYRHAAHVVALSPGMKEYIVGTGIPDDKVSVITNGCDLDLFRPGLDTADVRQQWGLGDEFVVIYFGAMGLTNGLEYVVEAAKCLRERGKVKTRFLMIGGGGRRTAVETLARGYGLDNVTFHEPVRDKALLARLVAGSHASLTVFAATRKEQSWSPNKFFDSISAGRPILINVPGWLGQMVEQNRCGRFVDPDQPESLADAIEALAANPSLCEEMGRNARKLAERKFSRDTLADRLESVLMRVVPAASSSKGM